MPRAQVYFSKENFARIENIIKKKIEDGADKQEVSVSSTVAMLVDIGLRIYEFREKNPHTEEDSVDLTAFNKIMMEQVLKTVYTANAIFKMVTCLDEIRECPPFSIDDVIKDIKEKAACDTGQIFGKGSSCENVS